MRLGVLRTDHRYHSLFAERFGWFLLPGRDGANWGIPVQKRPPRYDDRPMNVESSATYGGDSGTFFSFIYFGKTNGTSRQLMGRGEWGVVNRIFVREGGMRAIILNKCSIVKG